MTGDTLYNSQNGMNPPVPRAVLSTMHISIRLSSSQLHSQVCSLGSRSRTQFLSLALLLGWGVEGRAGLGAFNIKVLTAPAGKK